jgi:hypothetical protein
MIRIDYIQVRDVFRAILDTKDLTYFEKNNIITSFRMRHFYFNHIDNSIEFKDLRVLEFIEWCKKFGYNITISYEASVMLEKKRDEAFPVELKKIRPEEFDKSILHPGREPKNFQYECINYGILQNRLFLMDDPGLGKSYQSLCIAGHQYKKGRVDSIFLIVKPGLTYHWQKEILESLTLFTENDIKKITNENKYDIFKDAQDKKVMIVSNHIIAKLFAWYSEKIRKNPKNKNGIRKTSDIKWDFFCDFKKEWNKSSTYLIIDESQDFKNPESEKSKALNAHLSNFKYRMLLSATPFINDFVYSWFQFFILDPSIIRMPFYAFRVWIASRIGSKFSMYDIRAYDTQKVESIIIKSEPYIKKRLKTDLPEMKVKQIIKPLYFEMTAQQQILYDMMFEEELFKVESENPNSFFQYKDLTVNFPYTIQCIDNVSLLQGKLENKEMNKIINSWKLDKDPRIEWLDEYLRETIEEKGEKVVIFDTHPKTIDMLYERYQKYNPGKIHGQLNQSLEERQKIVDNFNDLKNPCKLIILSAYTSSAGINLQQGGSEMVVFTNPFDTLVFRQLIDRQYRINSTRDSRVWVCIIDKTFDNIRANRNFARAELNDIMYTEKYDSTRIKKLFYGLEKKD